MKKSIKFIIFGLAILIFPWFLEKGITYIPISSKFEENDWFAFWGSYSGAIITCIVLYLTIKYNNLQIKGALKEVEVREKFKEKIKTAEYAYRIISLEDYYPFESDASINSCDLIKHNLKELRLKIDIKDNCTYYNLVNEITELYLNKIDLYYSNIMLFGTWTGNRDTIEPMRRVFDSKRKEIDISYSNYKEDLEKSMQQEIKRNYKIL